MIAQGLLLLGLSPLPPPPSPGARKMKGDTSTKAGDTAMAAGNASSASSAISAISATAEPQPQAMSSTAASAAPPSAPPSPPNLAAADVEAPAVVGDDIGAGAIVSEHSVHLIPAAGEAEAEADQLVNGHASSSAGGEAQTSTLPRAQRRLVLPAGWPPLVVRSKSSPDSSSPSPRLGPPRSPFSSPISGLVAIGEDLTWSNVQDQLAWVEDVEEEVFSPMRSPNVDALREALREASVRLAREGSSGSMCASRQQPQSMYVASEVDAAVDGSGVWYRDIATQTTPTPDDMAAAASAPATQLSVTTVPRTTSWTSQLAALLIEDPIARLFKFAPAAWGNVSYGQYAKKCPRPYHPPCAHIHAHMTYNMTCTCTCTFMYSVSASPPRALEPNPAAI